MKVDLQYEREEEGFVHVLVHTLLHLHVVCALRNYSLQQLQRMGWGGGSSFCYE